ncbi:hypothetical protein [Pseudoduganella violacea]|uniref:Uncharacterized protein n=1 Tax=Pseudoduganella violacea TaxID=1715466 RepID=A0A7W5BA65_9BURK|nr:hypothetical protein [Pseudoduganella violacea]MBB3119412.1 hypothetical protein [Pseudoduganella violacea]
MSRVHPEFAYQSRELGGQIEGILGDPPDRKNYQNMIQALVSEYASGAGIEDLNMMAFALVDHIEFHDRQTILEEAGDFEDGDAARVFAAASCSSEAEKMYAALEENYPDLGRQAIITAFLHKHPRLWSEDDVSLDQLAEGDDGDDGDDDDDAVSDDFAQMFDQEGEQ